MLNLWHVKSENASNAGTTIKGKRVRTGSIMTAPPGEGVHTIRYIHHSVQWHTRGRHLTTYFSVLYFNFMFLRSVYLQRRKVMCCHP